MREQRETGRFQKGFFLGRIIWVRKEDGERALVRARSLLFSCNIGEGEVWTMAAGRFAGFVAGGMDRLLLDRVGVLLIRDLEGLSGGQASAFVRALRMFRTFQFGAGIRVILASGVDFPVELHAIHEMLPVVLAEYRSETDPCELDSRVHSLVEVASKVAETPIKRLTERAAHFLEESVVSSEGEEILLLLVEGMRRSKGSVLRLRDILPNFARYFGPEDGPETCCN
jgi:hypothetical protein